MKTALFAIFFTAIHLSSVSAATTTVLEGKYIGGAYVEGCDPLPEPVDQMDVRHDYRRIEPRHCTEVVVRNPVFVATVPSYADLGANMTLSLTPPSGPVQTITFKGARLVLPDANALTMQGLYKWSVTYKKRGENRFATTAERTFLFRNATLPPVPSAVKVRESIAGSSGGGERARPRLAPRTAAGQPMSGSNFRAMISATELRGSFEARLAHAEKWLDEAEESYPVTEPLSADDAGGEAYWQYEAVQDLALAAYVNEGSARQPYVDEAIRRLIRLAAWNTGIEATSSELSNDQANRSIYYTLGLGLDMFYGDLDDDQKDVLLIALKARLSAALAHMDTGMPLGGGLSRPSLVELPYESHLLTAALVATDTIMFATGARGKNEQFEAANAGQLLQDAWTRVVTTIGTWGGGTDSAYGNGVYYGWMTLDWYGRSLANYLIMSGENLTKLPALNSFHNNFLAFTSRDVNARLMSPFGDDAENRDIFKWSGFTYYRLYALVSGKKIDEWYYQPSLAGHTAALLPIQTYFLRAVKAPAELEEQLPPDDYLFEDAGTVAMHSSVLSPTRSSLYFRSSRLGSYSHNHADNNAFTFVSKGRDIFVSGGWYNEFWDALHANYTRPTRFKNALTYCDTAPTTRLYTCAGMGQSEPSVVATSPGAPLSTLRTPGKLVNYFVGPAGGWSVVTGDATKAYSGYVSGNWQPMLENAVRSVAYNRSRGIVVIYDWANSATPRYWQQNFQTLVAPVENPLSDRRLSIQPVKDVIGEAGPVSNGAPVCMRFHGLDGKFVTQPMTEITALANQMAPAQFHTTYTVLTPASQNVSVTVIAENCEDTESVRVTYVYDTKVVVDYGAASMTFDRDTVKLVQ